MELNHQGNPVLIKGLQPSGLDLQDIKKFFKPSVKKGLCLQILSTVAATVLGQSQAVIEELLIEFGKVFELSTGLPPLRGHEHQILLKEGTQAICERPYKYPFYHKSEIEKIVAKMLKAGSIRPTFSSDLVLVFSSDLAAHLMHLRQVLTALLDNHLFCQKKQVYVWLFGSGVSWASHI